MNLSNIHRIFYLSATKYKFLVVHRTYYKIDHILGHKVSLNKHKKIEIVSSTLSDHNTIKLESITRVTTENTQTHGD
jgi:hypothetical protein